MTTPAQTAYERADGQDESIKLLVMEHLALVRCIVSRVHVTFAPTVSEEDLISAGTLGLVEAAHRFDPSMGVKFSTFAYGRVKGAVVDCLRNNDQLAKSAREQLTGLRKCIGEFRKSNARKPTIEELAQETGMTEQGVLKYLSYEKWDYVGSLAANVTDTEGESRALAALIPDDEDTPLQQLESKERVEQLSKAIELLPEREKQVIVMYYYEQLYMAEMAEILGISESRVSQLHTRALYNLTRKLEGEL
jgi:RNA polymerase sigma factor for flagellar operon FliA